MVFRTPSRLLLALLAYIMHGLTTLTSSFALNQFVTCGFYSFESGLTLTSLKSGRVQLNNPLRFTLKKELVAADSLKASNSLDFEDLQIKVMDVGHCYLDGNADVVEFCPHVSFHHVLAASTYTLQEGDQPSRSGSISLFNVDLGRVDLFYRLKTAGIFDMKWNPVEGNATQPLLAQADADGFLRVHHLKNSINGDALEEVRNQKVSSSMCLCLDWNPQATSITVGLSDGSVSLISLEETKTSILQEWKAHDFEVWAVSFDPDQPHLVYTGSDDCKFKGWDLRNSPSEVAFQNSKAHQMGVCCIAKSPHNPNTLFTGSYDESLRIWDVRSISRPVNETSINLGGGVWRIKNHSVVPGLILAACMHNGFAIVKVNGSEAEVVETYNKHESLAYGADWYRGSICQQDKKEKTIVATCSFYDQLLRVWVPENDII